VETSAAIAKVELLIQKQGISLDSDTDTITEAITMAVSDYSFDKPMEKYIEKVGDGTKIYNLPSTFTWDFSSLLVVEYQVNRNPRRFVFQAGIEERYATVYKNLDGSSPQLILEQHAPTSSESFRLGYTYYSELVSDVRTEDLRAVLNLCASYTCNFMATRAAQQGSDGRNLSFEDKTSRSSLLTEMGSEFERKYREHVFGGEREYSPQSIIVNMDTDLRRRNRRIFNRREDT